MKMLPIIRDYMAKDLLTLKPQTDIYEAIRVLLEHKFSGAPVVDTNNNLIGIISEKDCLKLLTKGVDHKLPSGKVEEFMTKNVLTVTPNMDVYFAAGLFLKNPYRRLPVVENGKLVGQISRRDILRAIQEKLH